MAASKPPWRQEVRLKEVSARFLVFGNMEFGPFGEAFLGRPETVALGISKVRQGRTLEDAALELLYREARTEAGVREELLAWVAGRLLQRGSLALQSRLMAYPAHEETPFDAFLLGTQGALFTSGTYPGQDALVDRLGHLLEDSALPVTEDQALRQGFDAESTLAMIFLPDFDREVLRRVLLGENPAELAAALGISRARACRASTQVLRNARRRAQRRHTQS